MASPNGLGRISIQILALRIHVLGHSTLTRASFHLKTRQEYFLHDEESFWVLKTRFGWTWFSTHFGTPFAIFLGKWAKIGSLTNYCSVSPHYCCNDILYWNVDLSYRKDTNRVSWWWDMTGWWWKVGFTPRAIRHVHPYWQLSSLGVISSYIWVLSLETASWGAHTLGTIHKYPLFSPPSTTSDIILQNTKALFIFS